MRFGIFLNHSICFLEEKFLRNKYTIHIITFILDRILFRALIGNKDILIVYIRSKVFEKIC